MNLTPDEEKAYALLSTVDGYPDEDGGLLSWHELYSLGWHNPVDLLLLLLLPAVSMAVDESEEPIWLQDSFEDIVHCCLQELVITAREGHRLAVADWERLQQVLMKLMADPNSNAEVLHWLVHGVTEIGLVPTQVFLEADRNWQTLLFERRVEGDDVESDPEVFLETLQDMLDDYNIQDEYEVYDLFFNQLTHLPPGVGEEMMASFLEIDNPFLKDAATLFLLHPQEEIRATVLSLMEQDYYLKKLSPISLRRMITIRNWLSQLEREKLDSLIRRSRLQGNSCAPINNSGELTLEKVLASSIDGSGAQTVLSLFKSGRQFQLAGAVFKEGFGVVDTWVTGLLKRYECETVISRIKDEVYILEVEVSYLAHVIPHYLVMNVEAGQAIGPEILQWIEMLGIECWQPQPMDSSALVATWLKDTDVDLSESYIKKSLLRSGRWLGKKKFSLGWFEQDDMTGDRIRVLLRDLANQQHNGSIDISLPNAIMEPIRQKWLDRFIMLCLWVDSNAKRRGPSFEDFLILALQLQHEVPMSDIPLMAAIAGESMMKFVRDDSDMMEVGGDADSLIDVEDKDFTICVEEELQLEAFLEGEFVPEETLNFLQMLGFLYGVNCAPETFTVEQWINIIFPGAVIDRHLEPWREPVSTLLKYSDNFLMAIQGGRSYIPCDLNIDEQGYDYRPLVEWCRGLLIAINNTGGKNLWRESILPHELERFDLLYQALVSTAKYDGLPFTRKNLPDLILLEEFMGFMDFVVARRRRQSAS